MKQIFISYSRTELEFAKKLARDLREKGYDVWYDLSKLEGGDRWGRELQNAIRQSQIFLLIVSPNSVESEWVEKEFLYASNHHLRIVPLMYRACELPLWLLDIQYIDVQGRNYSKNFSEILEALADEHGAHTEGTASKEGVVETLEPKRRNSQKEVERPNLSVLLAIALVFLSIVGVWGFVSMKNQVTPTPVPSPTPTIYMTDTRPVVPVDVTLVTDTPTITPTFTLTPTSTLTPALESTVTPSPSPEPPIDEMTAVLTANLYEGRAPFRINFDARSSYVQFTDGRVVSCGNMNVCSYTFTIYRDNRWVDTISNGNGVLSYVFGAKGKYTVSVSVCRGEACGNSAVEVNIR